MLAVDKKNLMKRKAVRVIGKTACLLFETLILLLIAAFSFLAILSWGPSSTASGLFVRSVRETSAIGFLADIFFTPEEIQQMEAQPATFEPADSDPSLIVPTQPTGDKPDAWGLVDEDGDGIILETIHGEGYTGYMMIVLDPSRVFMACVPGSFGARGYTVQEMVEKFDAVAGINGGGFDDPEGRGDGSMPISMVVSDGNIYYAHMGCGWGFAGFDRDHILHVGRFTGSDIQSRQIQSGVGFGPVLISNGEISSPSVLVSGVSARTAIGQRSDGAVLFLLIEGRQVNSLGATYTDMAEIFLSYGAVNACNLDGGSSSMLWYGDRYVNRCASVVGIRRVPTTFLVMRKEAASND